MIADTILMEQQQGFRRGKSKIDNIFTLKQIAKRCEFNLETHWTVIDFDIAFDTVDHGKLWRTLEGHGCPLASY